MEITKPGYYDGFRCLAAACPDSCCKEWDVQVDEETAAYYRSLPGALGDRLRAALKTQDGQLHLTMENGRCPMWRQDRLCRIQAELGEPALCRVCRDFPRLRHDYGDFVELGLELSCPQAARLILGDDGSQITLTTQDAQSGSWDGEVIASLKKSRETALSLMEGDAHTPGEALTLLLFYGCQAQDELDGGEWEPFDREAAAENGRALAKEGNLRDFLDFFLGLEILTPRWQALLEQSHSPALPPETKALARYLIRRYWLQAFADYDLVCRVKFIVMACLLVGSLGGDYLETAQLFSKEIENDADNVDAILDAAYSCPALADARLLGLLRDAQ